MSITNTYSCAMCEQKNTCRAKRLLIGNRTILTNFCYIIVLVDIL